MEKVNMEDIAVRMGISKSTVSVAINDKYGVSEDLRSKIILTALEMGYDFSQTRISCKNNKNISIIIDNDVSVIGQFWKDIISGIEKEARNEKYSIKLYVKTQYENNTEMFSAIYSNMTKGVIFIASDNSVQELVEILKKMKLPVVFVDARNFFGEDCNYVGASDYNGGYEAAQYFIRNGHSNFMFLGSQDKPLSFMKRRNGFKDAIEQCGNKDYSYDEFFINDLASFSQDDLVEFLRTKRKPIAIFCANDSTAAVLNFFAKKENYLIPQDLSLIHI